MRRNWIRVEAAVSAAVNQSAFRNGSLQRCFDCQAVNHGLKVFPSADHDSPDDPIPTGFVVGHAQHLSVLAAFDQVHYAMNHHAAGERHRLRTARWVTFLDRSESETELEIDRHPAVLLRDLL